MTCHDTPTPQVDFSISNFTQDAARKKGVERDVRNNNSRYTQGLYSKILLRNKVNQMKIAK